MAASDTRDIGNRSQLRDAFLKCESAMNPCHQHAEERHGTVQGIELKHHNEEDYTIKYGPPLMRLPFAVKVERRM